MVKSDEETGGEGEIRVWGVELGGGGGEKMNDEIQS